MIPLPVIDGVLEIGKKLIDRFFPDPTEAAKAAMELEKMRQTGELAELAANTDLAKGQLEVNKAEASNLNLFVSGWRPFVGWVCGSSLAFQFIVYPLFVSFGLDIPSLDLSELVTILLGLLGLGALRTKEKLSGKS